MIIFSDGGEQSVNCGFLMNPITRLARPYLFILFGSDEISFLWIKARVEGAITESAILKVRVTGEVFTSFIGSTRHSIIFSYDLLYVLASKGTKEGE